MPKPPTKNELRTQLQQAIEEFVCRGGKIQEIPRGTSGREDAKPVATPLFDTPKTTRTYVTDLIAGIDARRRPAKVKSSTSPVRKRPHLEVVYDDFGEPIRKVWIDD